MVTKGKQTREAILERALAVASVQGLGGLTIGSLARETGLSKSGLYAHFRSKENLQLALLQSAIDRFVETVVLPAWKAPRGAPRIRALFDLWLRWAEAEFQPGGCIFVAAAAELDDQPGPLRDRLVQSQRDWLDSLAGAARIAMEEGHFRPDLDPVQFAYELHSLAHGYHFISRLLGDPTGVDRVRIAQERLLADATNPLAAPAPPRAQGANQ